MSIRLATTADAEQVRSIYEPYCSTPISFEATAPSLAEMERRIAAVRKSLPWLVAEQDGNVCGYAYASLHNERAAYAWSVNVSVYIDQGSHRRGLGRSLYARLFEILVDLGYVNAYAGITLPNPASVGLHTSMGFTPVGVYDAIGFKYGKWHDVAWFQKALRPRPAEPELPRSIGG